LLQASNSVVDGSARRQDQNRGSDTKLAQAKDQADAIQVWQSEIDDQDVESFLDREPLGSLAIRRRFDLIPSLLKGRFQEALYVEFVFNEQKSHEGILVHLLQIFMGA